MPLFLFGALSWLTFFTELRAKEISPNQEDHSKKYLNEVNKYYYSYRNAIKNDSFLSVWHDGKVIYGVESGGRVDFTQVNPVSVVNRRVFDPDQLAAEISRVTGKPVDAKKLPFSRMKSEGGRLKLQCFGQWYIWENQKLQPLKKNPAKRNDRSISPDGKWRVIYREHNAVLVNMTDKSERQITKDGTSKCYYSGTLWSPSSKKFLLNRVKAGQRRIVTMIEAAPKDQLQPKVHTHRYDKPGDIIDQRYPIVAYVDASVSMEVKAAILNNHFKLSHFQWRSDDEFTFHGVERGFGKYHVVLVDTKSRMTKVVIAEESETYVNWNKTSKNYRENKSSAREIIW